MSVSVEPKGGYASRAYAHSLAGFGEPLHLPLSGGNLLKRSIPGSLHHDAMGCYPLFFCEDWVKLDADLTELSDAIVSVALVADPFGDYTPELLDELFDVVNPFKQHYIVDLARDPDEIGTSHHRKAARRALRKLQVEVCKDPAGFTEDWIRLYHNLVDRYGINGIRAFSKEAFIRQLNMPEIVVHQAFLGDELVGAQLFYVQNGVVHCHLGAVTDKGYASGAFYAMDYFSFGYFAGKAHKLDLGGGVGLAATSENGLSAYKDGWCSETRPVYFCGKILNVEKYAELVEARARADDSYFPAYRCGEFG